MALTAHQKTVIRLCHENGGVVTKKQVCQVIRFYCHTEKHVGDILSRMVKSKLLERTKPGTFKLSTGTKHKEILHNPNQTELF